VLIFKESSFTLLPVKRGNLPDIFKDFPGLINKIPRLSKTFQDSKKIQDFSRMWQPCITLIPNWSAANSSLICVKSNANSNITTWKVKSLEVRTTLRSQLFYC